MRLIVGWWRDCAPSGADGLTFARCAIEGNNLLSWSHWRCGREFLRKILVLGREILSVETQISMKVLVYGENFSSRVIGQ